MLLQESEFTTMLPEGFLVQLYHHIPLIVIKAPTQLKGTLKRALDPCSPNAQAVEARRAKGPDRLTKVEKGVKAPWRV